MPPPPPACLSWNVSVWILPFYWRKEKTTFMEIIRRSILYCCATKRSLCINEIIIRWHSIFKSHGNARNTNRLLIFFHLKHLTKNQPFKHWHVPKLICGSPMHKLHRRQFRKCIKALLGRKQQFLLWATVQL